MFNLIVFAVLHSSYDLNAQLTSVGSNGEGALRQPYANHSASVVRPRQPESLPLVDESVTESPLLQHAEPSAADLLQSLIHDCGLSEERLHEFMEELPDRKSTDLLIDYYFKNM